MRALGTGAAGGWAWAGSRLDRAEASTHGVDLLMHLEEQAPLLRGCPDRGGERQAKGGARTLRSNVWGEARAAHFASRAR
ncbi:hypothetical protein CR919_05705 [Stenotrophomonas sp. LMG 10879]|nr:hypothetical protein CR919_05705 [Stenotrophomonas sp. LMG 10879]